MSAQKPTVYFNRWAIEAGKKPSEQPKTAVQMAPGRVVNAQTGTIEWSLPDFTEKQQAALNEVFKGRKIPMSKARYVNSCIKQGMSLKEIVSALERMPASERRQRFGTTQGVCRSTIAPIHHALNPSPTANRGRKKGG